MDSLRLPNGCLLYWQDNKVGGRIYYSNEINGGVLVWDTCLIDITTLQTAIMKERELQAIEKRAKEKENDDRCI